MATPRTTPPLPMTLGPGGRDYLVLGLCAVAVWAGFFRVVPHSPFLGVLGIVLFTWIGALIATTRLSLTKDEFVIGGLWQRHRVRWSDLESAVPVSIGSKRMVGLRYAPGKGARGRGRRLANKLTGVDGALPSTFGMSAEELADLMNRIREANATGARDR